MALPSSRVPSSSESRYHHVISGLIQKNLPTGDRNASLVIVSVLALILCSVPSAQAQVTIDATKITCDQFVHSKVGTPRITAAWLSGFYNGKHDNRIIDTTSVRRKSKQVGTLLLSRGKLQTPGHAGHRASLRHGPIDGRRINAAHRHCCVQLMRVRGFGIIGFAPCAPPIIATRVLPIGGMPSGTARPHLLRSGARKSVVAVAGAGNTSA